MQAISACGLTIRSSRPRVVASAVCFTLRLHTSAAPPQGGLTQALGGKKLSTSSAALVRSRLRSFLRRCCLPLLRLWLLGRLVFLRTLHWARSCFACVAFADFGCSDRLAVGSVAPDGPLRIDPAESSLCALRPLGFGVRQRTIQPWHGQLAAPRRLGRLTSRSSRRRVVAPLKLLDMRAILAPIRRVRRGLTPALGPTEWILSHC